MAQEIDYEQSQPQDTHKVLSKLHIRRISAQVPVVSLFPRL